MAIKNILVHVDSSTQSAAIVKAAASVAKKFDAGLNGFHVLPDVAVAAAVPGGGMVSATIVEDMQEDAEKRAGRAEEIFRKAADELASPDGWVCVDSMGIGSRAAAARVAYYADLVVMGRLGEEDEPVASGVYPQDLVVDSGRPLLFMPPTDGPASIGKTVVVAWSESREAARSVQDALPFLMAADTVKIVSVVKKDEDGSESVRKMARLLKDHGIEGAAETVTAQDDQSTSGALFDYARKVGADLMVAGAYSHSRLREGIFGGVTKSIFDSAPLPVLLSH